MRGIDSVASTEGSDDVVRRLTIKNRLAGPPTTSSTEERVDLRDPAVDVRIDGVDRELRTAIDIRERLATLEARRA
jgi:hypothetical protein